MIIRATKMGRLPRVRAILAALGVVSMLMPAFARAEHPAAGWQLEKQGDGIVIHSRPVSGSSIREVGAIVDLNAGVMAASHFLQDPATNPQWVPSSKNVSILDRPTPGVTLVHFVMDGTWPFQPRDAVARFELTQTTDDAVWIRFYSQPQWLPDMPGTVRMKTYSGCWRLTPQSPKRTRLEYRSHIEAGGSVPAWLANSVAVRSTFRAMQNLSRLVPAYSIPDAKPLAFLREPAHFPSGEIPPMGERECDDVFRH